VTSTAAVTAPKKTSGESSITKGIQERDLASAASTEAETQQAKVIPVTAEQAKLDEGAEKAKPIEETSKEPTTAKVAPQAEPAGGCAEGKEARDAAASSSDNSDKLFHLRKALRLCPNSAETHYELGQAYLHMDRAADASYEFKQALSINPGYAAAQQSLKELDQGKLHY
jgi:Flp pilus assembly protein TadD